MFLLVPAYNTDQLNKERSSYASEIEISTHYQTFCHLNNYYDALSENRHYCNQEEFREVIQDLQEKDRLIVSIIFGDNFQFDNNQGAVFLPTLSLRHSESNLINYISSKSDRFEYLTVNPGKYSIEISLNPETSGDNQTTFSDRLVELNFGIMINPYIRNIPVMSRFAWLPTLVLMAFIGVYWILIKKRYI
jgi:hypothetical protein